MPFNGAGVYSAPGADFPAVTQTVISSTHYNNVINDIATGLSLCLTKDGQQTATANIPFGGFRATNVGITGIAGSVGTPAINVSDAGTGLYRSAVSELAVTVAGTQRGRFDATGLIVTGTVNASTSVVTPSVGTGSATPLALSNNASTWAINGPFYPIADNTQDIGLSSSRVRQIFVPIIDSGTTGSLSLKTNNGTTQFVVTHTAGTIVNAWQATGNITTLAPQLLATGTDANVPAQLALKGTGAFSFITDALGTPRTQLQLLHGTGANNLTITNGTNPTLDVTAGNLAITPAIVVAGAFVSVGGTPASAGGIRLPVNIGIQSRNAANSGDVSLVQGQTVNGVADVVVMGSGGSGVVGIARAGGAAPSTTDLAAGRWTVWRDTVGLTTKLYYNNAGAIQSVALA